MYSYVTESFSRKEKKRQANFLLPEQLIDELRTLVPPKKRSLVVATALERELERIKVNARSVNTSAHGKGAGA